MTTQRFSVIQYILIGIASAHQSTDDGGGEYRSNVMNQFI